ncbi:acyltransferase [Mucilaginibacter paludis]|uniref:Acetyltransferase, CysE/LacA/LpxA/NodL family n=1 Tax=Mucilaginibacter paludis DSM 18603 TaxID=714943 RepID=H1Y0I9_9SPHI|nr:acetyltransferase [Mucilaginibacter paludis]EHQ28456.1 acetyltransferase, CysE/LacA/LpxA/NodL family [Mucilaginibacter paludis DSM 18603]
MASLSVLFKNRAKFPLFSLPFFKAWAKRILLWPEMYQRSKTRRRLVYRGAIISRTAEIGKVYAGGNAKNLIVGDHTFIGTVELALHDKIQIGSYVCINDQVKILTASHGLNDPYWKHVKAPIIIDDYAWIATSAIILPGVKIGRGAVVGAGAVVSKNVEPFQIVAGNPAKAINKTRTEDLRYNPCEFLAVNQAWLKG